MNELLQKIEQANLIGRGGTGFPVAKKWSAVIAAEGDEKFVICNASEGEPGVKKDWGLLQNHMNQVFKGIYLACQITGAKECWLNCNHSYLEKLKPELEQQVADFAEKGITLHLFEERENSYLGGESSTIMNAIEGKKEVPRNKKYHATEVGLYGKPTLINNVETFYDIAAVHNGTFDNTRLYTITGAVKNPGVYRLSSEATVAEVLDETGNTPDKGSFVQVGGSACGPVWRGESLKQPATGAGSIEVYDPKTTPKDLLKKWLTFFHAQLCGTCTPCRDGTFQLLKLIKEKDLPWEQILEITEAQRLTAFCGLGRSIDTPIRSLYELLHDND